MKTRYPVSGQRFKPKTMQIESRHDSPLITMFSVNCGTHYNDITSHRAGTQ